MPVVNGLVTGLLTGLLSEYLTCLTFELQPNRKVLSPLVAEYFIYVFKPKN